MRGTLSKREHRIILGGIIPAHAGNTVEHDAPADEKGDHPRACGEHETPHVNDA